MKKKSKPQRVNWKKRFFDLQQQYEDYRKQWEKRFTSTEQTFKSQLEDSLSLTSAMGRILQMVEITDRYQQIEKTKALECLTRIRTNWTFPGDKNPPAYR